MVETDYTTWEGSFTPVAYEFRELIAHHVGDGFEGRIFFFNRTGVFDSVDGRVVALEEIQGAGMFIRLEPFAIVRIDRVITLFGKPGPAYDEYDRLGNRCMECNFDEDP